MTYAIIKVAGKQYRVREGERLLVDRLRHDEGAIFSPTVLLVGGNGTPQLEPGDGLVTAKILGDTKGPKIRIGKYKKRTGYKRHTGFRASLTQIQIESIGAAKPSRAAAKPKAEPAEEKDERVKGMPSGYEDMTVAEIKEASSGWNRPMLESALEYEQAHAKRKGAIAAVESALAEKEGDS
ncbi:MAG TPA: 50S ribosomal protein L21 [Gaiellaceae bacterium]|nr:50S ribosomal protein L21 [Gaiellaceae bacterium]